MGRRLAPLLAVVLACLAGGAFLFLVSETRLIVENLDRATAPLLEIEAPERFEMSYVHSMYDRPVEEAFRREGDHIVLEAVKTDHHGIAQYYGAEEPSDLFRVDRDLGPSVVMQIGPRGGQALRIGGRVFMLKEMGSTGDRIRVALTRIPLWKRLWNRPRHTGPEDGKPVRRGGDR